MLKLRHGNKPTLFGKTDLNTQYQKAQATNLVADLVALAATGIDRSGSRDPVDHQFKRWGRRCQTPGGCIDHHDHYANTGDRHRGIGRARGDDLPGIIGAPKASRDQREGTSYQHTGEQDHYSRVFRFGQTDPVDP